jgi:uncharacterized membrane protein
VIWLVLGVLLWSAVHLFPGLGVARRASVLGRLGEQRYKGVFTLGILSSLVLMVVGWRASPAIGIYGPPGWGRWAAAGIVLVALILFVASGLPSNLKRWIRHPQLLGIALWALAHLLSNGDRRSLVLFGTLGSWAVVEMLVINRRDGARQRPDLRSWAGELKPVLGGLAIYAVLFWAHPYLFNVSPLPG